MKHRIFYGSDFKLNDSDKKMFSRDGYECKALLQGKSGMPVAVSQKWCNVHGSTWSFKKG